VCSLAELVPVTLTSRTIRSIRTGADTKVPVPTLIALLYLWAIGGYFSHILAVRP
jgi:hypothetical protein